MSLAVLYVGAMLLIVMVALDISPNEEPLRRHSYEIGQDLTEHELWMMNRSLMAFCPDCNATAVVEAAKGDEALTVRCSGCGAMFEVIPKNDAKSLPLREPAFARGTRLTPRPSKSTNKKPS